MLPPYMAWKLSVRHSPLCSRSILKRALFRARRCRPEEGCKVLRTKVRNGCIRDEEPTRAGRNRRPGRCQLGDRRYDRRGRWPAQERAEGQHSRGRGEIEEGLNGAEVAADPDGNVKMYHHFWYDAFFGVYSC